MRSEKNNSAVIVVGLICATVLLFAVFFWPTPYRYERVQEGVYYYKVYRINRLTGWTEEVNPVK